MAIDELPLRGAWVDPPCNENASNAPHIQALIADKSMVFKQPQQDGDGKKSELSDTYASLRLTLINRQCGISVGTDEYAVGVKADLNHTWAQSAQ